MCHASPIGMHGFEDGRCRYCGLAYQDRLREVAFCNHEMRGMPGLWSREKECKRCGASEMLIRDADAAAKGFLRNEPDSFVIPAMPLNLEGLNEREI